MLLTALLKEPQVNKYAIPVIPCISPMSIAAKMEVSGNRHTPAIITL
jgi:hypothetical protein